MERNVTIYYKNSNGKNARLQYKAMAMQAGPAWQILGKEDAAGNGIPQNAPLIMLRLADGGTATFDADNVTILFD